MEWRHWQSGSKMAASYRSMHVALIPSRATETWTQQFGRVIVEAQASGAVVAGYVRGSIAKCLATPAWPFQRASGGRLPTASRRCLPAGLALTRSADRESPGRAADLGPGRRAIGGVVQAGAEPPTAIGGRRSGVGAGRVWSSGHAAWRYRAAVCVARAAEPDVAVPDLGCDDRLRTTAEAARSRPLP